MGSLIGITLRSGDFKIDRAFRIALGDMLGNVMRYKSGVLEREVPCLVAGLSYPDPWTRDAAFNTWSGAGLLIPEVMKNTLLSCLTRGDASAGMGTGCNDVEGSKVPSDCLSIAGQYWDRIIWAVGAWAYYCQNGDRDFLELAFEAVKNSLPYLEENEFDAELGLFRGGACIADGIGAYGDRYANVEDCGIYRWPACNPTDRHPKGAGLPLMAMSSNCLYVEAYRLVQVMADTLGREKDAHWESMRQAVVAGIQAHLWDEAGQFFRVYHDPWGGSGPHQETLGNCFALLFGVATEAQREAIVRNQPYLAYGTPAVWPDHPRYRNSKVPVQSCPPGREDIAAENVVLKQFPDIRAVAGHGEAVWPLMTGIWGEAVLQAGHTDLFARELRLMADVFCRAVQSPEVIHPECGAPGGVLGERGTPPEKQIERAVSCYRQTWSATSYLRLILHGLLGIECLPEGLRFRPCLPAGIDKVELLGMPWRDATLNLLVMRETVDSVELDGVLLVDGLLPQGLTGEHSVLVKSTAVSVD